MGGGGGGGGEAMFTDSNVTDVLKWYGEEDALIGSDG